MVAISMNVLRDRAKDKENYQLKPMMYIHKEWPESEDIMQVVNGGYTKNERARTEANISS